MKGLLVEIYRNGSDCTNGGVTSPANAPRGMAVLLGVPDGNWSLEERPQGVPVLVVRHRLIRGLVYVDAVPYGETRHTSMGGNFVYTSDSRYHVHVCQYPIPVHDRIEP